LNENTTWISGFLGLPSLELQKLERS